jgi:hypothetical protein
LDSSLVAAVASRQLAQTEAANVWGAQLHTFSVGLKVLLLWYSCSMMIHQAFEKQIFSLGMSESLSTLDWTNRLSSVLQKI